MEPTKTGATEVASPPAKTESAITAESLKAAQNSAEEARKESASLREMLEESQTQAEEFQEKLASFEKRMEKDGKIEKGVLDVEKLADTLEAQAAAGDKDALAVLKAAERRAMKVYSEASMKERMESSYDQQESFLDAKAKEHGMTPEKLSLAIDEHAAAFANKMPHVQAQLAYAAWSKEQSFSAREARIVAEEKKLGLYRDGGTEGAAGETKKVADGPGNWRDAKTSTEKRAQLDSI